MPPRVSVAIYNDLGTTPHCVKQLRNCIQQNIPGARISTLSATESIEKLACKSIDLFCVGGGFARGVINKLGSIGLGNLRSFVLSGGSYLGICSGAYLASSITKFDTGGPLEVNDTGILNFFPGTAEGPLFGRFAYNSESGVSAPILDACATLNSDIPTSLAVYFNGGCHFLNFVDNHTSILYLYRELGTPAILRRRCGQGTVLLSGAHFEFDPANLGELDADPHIQRILPPLLEHDASRVKLCRTVLLDLVKPIIGAVHQTTRFTTRSHESTKVDLWLKSTALGHSNVHPTILYVAKRIRLLHLIQRYAIRSSIAEFQTVTA
ncbi:Biotin--protein ligase [Echinococcus granulosus]|uniref:Biotin--protein ligase n=1 Tax=Echinococcus granulosus TaxID=6210 RepID=W6V363_ECHGR|nr:Biotin--protein ligase [Echinococcus granulosus]EUB60459.1 Biotin--protein ligase [Echinococcus granulosus]